MFGFLKKLFGGVDEVAQNIAAELEKQDQYWRGLSVEALSELPPEELIHAVASRVRALTESEETDVLARMNRHQLVFYSAYCYEAEVRNGGLLQLFGNESRVCLPYVREALNEIGACAHGELFGSYVEENGGDAQLQEIASGRAALQGNDAIKAFDERFFALPPLQEALVSYVTAHISAF